MAKRRNNREYGSALVLAMMAVLIMSVVGVGLLTLGVRGRTMAIRDSQQIEARSAADAGLVKAVYQMNEMLTDKTLSDESLPLVNNESLPYAQSDFSYNVGTNDDGRYVVLSVGNAGQAVKTVIGILRLKGLFDYAILTKNEMTLKSGTTIGGYNSSDLSDTDIDTKIATASTAANQIILNNGVVVEGDLFVGMGGDPDVVIKDQGATFGDKYSMKEKIKFPKVTPPGLAKKGKLTVNNGTLTIGPGDSGEYTEIYVKKGVLEVTGGGVSIYITGDITLGNSTEIAVNDDSSLTLYLDGDLKSSNGSGINNKGKIPKNFIFYGTGDGEQDLDFKAKNDFYGVIYAPDDYVVVRAGGDIYGSIVCDEFDFKNGGDFLYDEALREVTIADPGVKFTIERWSEQ